MPTRAQPDTNASLPPDVTHVAPEALIRGPALLLPPPRAALLLRLASVPHSPLGRLIRLGGNRDNFPALWSFLPARLRRVVMRVANRFRHRADVVRRLPFGLRTNVSTLTRDRRLGRSET